MRTIKYIFLTLAVLFPALTWASFTCYILRHEGTDYEFKFRVTYEPYSAANLKLYSYYSNGKDAEINFAGINACKFSENNLLCETTFSHDMLKVVQIKGDYYVTAWTDDPITKNRHTYLSNEPCTLVGGHLL